MSTPTTIVDISQDPGLNYLSTPAVATVQQRQEKGLPAGNVIFNSVTEVRNVYIKQTVNTPGGANGEVQFNNANTFSGDPEFKYNPTTNQLEVDGNIVVGNIYADNFIFANNQSIVDVLGSGGGSGVSDYNDLTNKPIIDDTTSLVGGDFFIAKDETTISLGQWAAQTLSFSDQGIILGGSGGVRINGAAGSGIELGGGTTGTITFSSPTTGIDYNDLSNAPSGGASTGNITFSDTTLTSSNGNVKIHFSPIASPAVEFNFAESGEFTAGEVNTRLVRSPSQIMSLINTDGVGVRIDSFNQPTSIDIGDTSTWDFVRLRYGAGSVTGNDGDVEIRSTPMGSPAAPSAISISPQGGENGSFIFGGNGTLTVPGSITSPDRLTLNSVGVTSEYTAAVLADGNLGRVFVRTLGGEGATLHTWEFNKEGQLMLPFGGDIVDNAGQSVLGGGGAANTGDITFVNNSIIGTTDVIIGFDQVASPAVTFSFTENGIFRAPVIETGSVEVNGATIRTTNSVECLPNVDTVVYTSSSDLTATIKALFQVDGHEQGTESYDAQSCEMMVARMSNKVAGSVYGLAYTSVAPLATFNARHNSQTNTVEITCRPASSADSVYVRTTATEMLVNP